MRLLFNVKWRGSMVDRPELLVYPIASHTHNTRSTREGTSTVLISDQGDSVSLKLSVSTSELSDVSYAEHEAEGVQVSLQPLFSKTMSTSKEEIAFTYSMSVEGKNTQSAGENTQTVSQAELETVRLPKRRPTFAQRKEHFDRIQAAFAAEVQPDPAEVEHQRLEQQARIDQRRLEQQAREDQEQRDRLERERRRDLAEQRRNARRFIAFELSLDRQIIGQERREAGLTVQQRLIRGIKAEKQRKRSFNSRPSQAPVELRGLLPTICDSYMLAKDG